MVAAAVAAGEAVVVVAEVSRRVAEQHEYAEGEAG